MNQPGKYTSEFWLTLTAMVLGTVLYIVEVATGGDGWLSKALAAALTILPPVSYSGGRAKVKAAASHAAAAESIATLSMRGSDSEPANPPPG